MHVLSGDLQANAFGTPSASYENWITIHAMLRLDEHGYFHGGLGNAPE
jgi:hypothetical protein